MTLKGFCGDKIVSLKAFKRLQLLTAICCLSFFSLVGEWVRIFLEQLFGNACHNPGTVGWNKSNWAPCTADPGTKTSTGGAVFIDLPANMLGCFVMGFFIAGNDERLFPVSMPVACLPRSHRLQRWKFCQLGIRTGFCAACTSFASWNTQMVVMICGGKGTQLDTQWVSALFGYMIGMGMAVVSYIVGTHAAILLRGATNPDLVVEANALAENAGLVVNRLLPDFERRFLHNLAVEELHEKELSSYRQIRKEFRSSDSKTSVEDKSNSAAVAPLDHLQRWKDTTDAHRCGSIKEGGQCLSELHEIEHAILVSGKEPCAELLELALYNGWDIEAQKRWKAARQTDDENPTEVENHDLCLQLCVSLVLLLISMAFLVWGAVAWNDKTDAVERTQQIACISSLMAPSGTLLRWRLSELNGRSKKWPWLPIGTLSANLLGCLVSALMVALPIVIDVEKYFGGVFLASLKGGLAGCLSTVSTFVAETVVLMNALPQHYYGYYYSIGTIVLACMVGVISYVWAVV